MKKWIVGGAAIIIALQFMVWLRVGLVFVGTLLFLFGVVKVAWEIYSWGKLAELGQRPALIGNSPRVTFRIEIVVAALGAAVVALGILL